VGVSSSAVGEQEGLLKGGKVSLTRVGKKLVTGKNWKSEGKKRTDLCLRGSATRKKAEKKRGWEKVTS